MCCWSYAGNADSPAVEMTIDSVDAALEEVRPYLIADGGNVTVAAVEAGVVMLQLEVRHDHHDGRAPYLNCSSAHNMSVVLPNPLCQHAITGPQASWLYGHRVSSVQTPARS